MKDLELISLPAAPSVLSPLLPRSKPLASAGPGDNRDASSEAPQVSHRLGSGGSGHNHAAQEQQAFAGFSGILSHQEKELYLISPLPT